MPVFTVDPTGHIKLFTKTAIPAGYLACDGSVISQATYASLYSVIGSTYNTSGEGVGNFRLPDFRGKTHIGSGLDSTRGLTNRVAGTYHGEENHAIINTEVPTHTHSGTTDMSSNTHTHTGQSTGAVDLSHNHYYTYTGNRGDANNCSARPISCYSSPQSGGSNISMLHNHNVSITGVSGTHNHTVYTTSTGSGLTGNSHNNMMPSHVLQFCIKY